MFVVRVLGGLSIERTSGPVPAGARQRRRLSLLALLALGGERGLSRELIQSYLWPESDAARARHALDQLIYATRRELGYEAIVSTATDLRLGPACVRSDIDDFDRAIREQRWEDAVGAYSGPVLNGLHLGDSAELERWIDAHREQREQDYRQALDALAAAATRRGDPTDAVRWRRRLSAADPLSVPVALDLMRSLEAADDRAGALRHARTFQQLLTSSLEVEADPAITALANAIATRGAASDAGASDTPIRLDSSPQTVNGGVPSAQVAVTVASMASAPRHSRVAVGRVAVLIVGLTAIAVALLARGRALRPLSTAGASVPVAGTAVQRVGEAIGGRVRDTDRPIDAEARSLYLRGRAAWEKRTREPLERAVVLFRQATERDPEYAAAYAGLAQSYAMLGYFGFAPGSAMFPKARAAALRAIALDSTAGDAFAALGQALAWEHAWGDAEVAYRRALELTPGDATAHQWYALLLAYLGRAREAAAHTGHASELDPLSVQVNNMHGMMLYYAGDLRGALRQYEQTVDIEPDSAWVRRNPWVLTNFSRVAAAAGRHAIGVRLAERAVEVVPSHPRPLLDLAYVYAAAGKSDSARAAFGRADSTHAHYPVYRALLHGFLGERDEAFAWFERVSEWPLPALVTLNCEPRLAALRADRQFERVRARLGMPAR